MPNRSRGRLSILAILMGAAALPAASAFSSPPASQMHAKLQIKPGLWEFDDSAKITGDTVFPDAVLDGVPAAQRARHLAELRQMISRPSRERECITQAVFEQRVFGIETDCKRTIAANTSSRFEVTGQCHGAAGGLTQSKTSQVLATSPTAVITSFHAVSTRAGRTMITDAVKHGRWISSNCGNVHGIEQL